MRYGRSGDFGSGEDVVDGGRENQEAHKLVNCAVNRVTVLRMVPAQLYR